MQITIPDYLTAQSANSTAGYLRDALVDIVAQLNSPEFRRGLFDEFFAPNYSTSITGAIQLQGDTIFSTGV